MVNKASRKTSSFDEPAIYQITLRGKVVPGWSDRLEGMQVSLVTEDAGASMTTMIGELTDQASLAGVLNTFYELHLTVISVKRLNN